jgi:non-ribosomal peptide synthetase component E (peptide arylation enzyme)
MFLIKNKEKAVNVYMTLRKALDFYPEQIAVIDGKRSYTYRQIGKRVAGLARFLKSQGIQTGRPEKSLTY